MVVNPSQIVGLLQGEKDLGGGGEKAMEILNTDAVWVSRPTTDKVTMYSNNDTSVVISVPYEETCERLKDQRVHRG